MNKKRHKRTNFTENQKAEIFARDRATCAFSGISLWLLDAGIRSNWQIDWADHIIPSAAGGEAELANGICASHTFNAKKRNNAADNIYFVRNGEITEHYIKVFGVPSSALVEQLQRLSALEPADWFFNRAVSSVFVGFDWRCDAEFKGKIYKRTDIYWFKSGWKRLQNFHRKRGNQSIIDKGLIKNKCPFGTKELLCLEQITTEKDYLDFIESIYPIYRNSYKALNQYFNLVSYEARLDYAQQVAEMRSLHPEIIKAIKSHADLLSERQYVKEGESNVH